MQLTMQPWMFNRRSFGQWIPRFFSPASVSYNMTAYDHAHSWYVTISLPLTTTLSLLYRTTVLNVTLLVLLLSLTITTNFIIYDKMLQQWTKTHFGSKHIFYTRFLCIHRVLHHNTKSTVRYDTVREWYINDWPVLLLCTWTCAVCWHVVQGTQYHHLSPGGTMICTELPDVSNQHCKHPSTKSNGTDVDMAINFGSVPVPLWELWH